MTGEQKGSATGRERGKRVQRRERAQANGAVCHAMAALAGNSESAVKRGILARQINHARTAWWSLDNDRLRSDRCL